MNTSTVEFRPEIRKDIGCLRKKIFTATAARLDVDFYNTLLYQNVLSIIYFIYILFPLSLSLFKSPSAFIGVCARARVCVHARTHEENTISHKSSEKQQAKPIGMKKKKQRNMWKRLICTQTFNI